MTDPLEQDVRPADLEEGFKSFFIRHKDDFLKVAVSRLRNLHDADDALMEAAIQMHRKWERIDAHPNSVALAYTILHTKITDFYRRRARHADVEVPTGTDTALYADSVTVDDILMLRGYEPLDYALEQLHRRAPKQADCLRLHYLLDMDFAQIAEYLNLTTGAVKTNVSLARKQLNALMDLPATGKGDSHA